MARRNWFLEQWKRMFFFEESLFFLFTTTGQVYVLRQLKEEFYSNCLQSTVKNGWGYVMTWPMIFLMEELTKETI